MSDDKGCSLAPYALSSGHSRGRKYPEKSHSLRNEFQRDRDRILHSTAFRRLQYKTQVFVNHEGDHYRTRLTHTLEASQIGRTIARALGLNEDLTEAIALAHDIGHGPFGHAGEWALRDLMKEHGGFEHNRQSIRIVEKLEDSYPEFPGLNLTFETLEGLKKHPEIFYEDRKQRFRSLEADLVDLADEIAYNTHDLDDGLRSGLICEDQLKEVDIWNHAFRYIERKYPGQAVVKKRRLAIRLIINQLVMDCIEQTRSRLEQLKPESVDHLQSIREPIVIFSSDTSQMHINLKRFLHKNLYSHEYVVKMTNRGQELLKDLFQTYIKNPGELPADIRARSDQEGLHRVVCDYIAGMTDRFAQDEHSRLINRT